MTLKLNWKKLLSEFLADVGLIPEKFTGQVTINVNDGVVSNAEIKKKVS